MNDKIKNEIIEKVIVEFENKIKYWFNLDISIPIIETTDNWDAESAFHYSEENGLSSFVENEGNKEICQIIKKGKRTFLIFEYIRKTAPNLPSRKIYMGEIISVNNSINLKGSENSFAGYVSEKDKFLNIISKLDCLDNFKIKLIKECNELNCL